MKLSYNDNIEIIEFKDLQEISAISKKYLKKGNIALSGGSTYLKLLRSWGEEKLDLDEINFFPVDERVVDFDSEYSNWGNSYRDFLSNYNKNRDHHFKDASKYNDFLKNIEMDTIFLGVGDDGHTASLFSIDEVFKSPEKKAISTISPKDPKNRISLTGNYITSAQNIVIIFYGAGKEEIVQKVITGKELPITTLLKKVKNGVIYIHQDLLQE